VSRNRHLQAPGCIVVPSLEDAWREAGDAEEACVIGGTSLFEEALPAVDTIHLTEVDAEVEGDTFFPPFDRGDWVEQEIARHPADGHNAYPIRILELRRR
jgi:dihydrofolate reductase